MTMPETDTEDWATVPSALLTHPTLSARSRVVGALLARHAADSDSATVFPGRVGLAASAGIGESALSKCLAALEDAGYVRSEYSANPRGGRERTVRFFPRGDAHRSN